MTDQRALRILLVEDNPGDVELIREALTDGRLLNALDVAPDGERALARLRDPDVPLPDVVLLDLNLPMLDGHAVLDAIRADGRTRRLPVVVLTTSGASQDIDRAYAHGANSYIVKPVDLSRFLEAMRAFERFWLHIVALPDGREGLSRGEADRPPATPADSGRRPTAPARPEWEAAPKPEAEDAPSPADRESSRSRVLVVEDNPGDAELVETLVEDHAPRQFSFRFARDLAEADAALAEDEPDIVLLDLSLPGSTGFATFDAVRRRAGTVPIIVMTGLEDEALALQTMQGGAQDYVVKGRLGADELVRTMRHAIERARADATLRRAQKIEAMARLAGGVAHDFNNMLQVIRGHAELIDALSDDEVTQEGSAAILDACGRATDLMRQLLSFGSRPITFPRAMPLDGVVEGTRTLVRGLMGESIRVEYDLDSGAWVRGDPVQIEQVLLNLALNARHAMEENGTLRVTTAISEAAPRRPSDAPVGTHCVLVVEDDGCGMTDEVRERAFEPFFTTRTAKEGSGLGLSSVYGIARQMGGVVEIESEVGTGTRFIVRLPLDASRDVAEAGERRPESRAEAEAPASDAWRILVVEDEDMIRRMLQRMFGAEGWETVVAVDAEDGERRFREADGRFDLLVTDIVMPGASGVDLYRTLVVERPGLPVVFISGYSDDRLARAGQLPGPYQFVEKPFDRQTLVSAARRLLEPGGAG
jgi:CheY-like chemotaxis protein